MRHYYNYCKQTAAGCLLAARDNYFIDLSYISYLINLSIYGRALGLDSMKESLPTRQHVFFFLFFIILLPQITVKGVLFLLWQSWSERKLGLSDQYRLIGCMLCCPWRSFRAFLSCRDSHERTAVLDIEVLFGEPALMSSSLNACDCHKFLKRSSDWSISRGVILLSCYRSVLELPK